MTPKPIPIPVDLDPRLWTDRELDAAAASFLLGFGSASLDPAALSGEIDRRRALSAHERIADERRRRAERPELGG
jgi:hypothetical protein